MSVSPVWSQRVGSPELVHSYEGMTSVTLLRKVERIKLGWKLNTIIVGDCPVICVGLAVMLKVDSATLKVVPGLRDPVIDVYGRLPPRAVILLVGDMM